MNRYLRDVFKKIERNKHYPYWARSRRIEGKTAIRFELHDDGTIR